MVTDRLLTAAAPAGPDPSPLRSRDWWALAVILLAGFMQLLDGTIVTVATVSIQTDLHATNAQLQWILAGYTLAFAAGLITGGRLGDVFGRRRLFLIGVLAFTGASLLCGVAPTAASLVAARVVQGLTAAMMYPQVTSIIHTSFTGPARARARAFGAFGATLGLAGLAGPVVGGALISANLLGWDWRPIFLVNVPVGIVTAVAARALVRESRAPDRPRLDLVGSLLGTAGIVLLVYPVIQGREYDWAGWIWAVMGASVVVLGLFFAHQRDRQAGGSPLVDFRLFDRSARFGVGVGIVFTFFAGISSLFFVLAIYLQGGYGYSALRTGLVFMPIALASTVASGISIPLVARIGKVMIQIGAVVMAIGIVVLMVSLPHGTERITPAHLLPGTVILGLGLGAAIATINNVSLAEARGPSAGSAAGVQSTMAQLGNSVGVALLGTIFFSLLTTHDYSTSLRRSLVYFLAILLLTVIGVFFLPRRRVDRIGPT